MKYDILTLTLFGYGISFTFWKDNYNPNNKNNRNDGSIKKFRFYKPYFCKFSNPYCGVRINYDYTFMVKILIGRE